MIEVTEKAADYAASKANEVMSNAIALAYETGYRDGYKDRDAEIPIDFRDNKTEFVDLGLPSKTLWSDDYEKEGDSYIYLPYDKAIMYDIPTIEQWNELIKYCRWDFVLDETGQLVRVDLVGPNAKVINFHNTGMIKAIQMVAPRESFFWVKMETQECKEKYAVHLYRHYNSITWVDISIIEKTFSGFKLPLRLVRTK